MSLGSIQAGQASIQVVVDDALLQAGLANAQTRVGGFLNRIKRMWSRLRLPSLFALGGLGAGILDISEVRGITREERRGYEELISLMKSWRDTWTRIFLNVANALTPVFRLLERFLGAINFQLSQIERGAYSIEQAIMAWLVTIYALYRFFCYFRDKLRETRKIAAGFRETGLAIISRAAFTRREEALRAPIEFGYIPFRKIMSAIFEDMPFKEFYKKYKIGITIPEEEAEKKYDELKELFRKTREIVEKDPFAYTKPLEEALQTFSTKDKLKVFSWIFTRQRKIIEKNLLDLIPVYKRFWDWVMKVIKVGGWRMFWEDTKYFLGLIIAKIKTIVPLVVAWFAAQLKVLVTTIKTKWTLTGILATLQAIVVTILMTMYKLVIKIVAAIVGAVAAVVTVIGAKLAIILAIILAIVIFVLWLFGLLGKAWKAFLGFLKAVGDIFKGLLQAGGLLPEDFKEQVQVKGTFVGEVAPRMIGLNEGLIGAVEDLHDMSRRKWEEEIDVLRTIRNKLEVGLA